MKLQSYISCTPQYDGKFHPNTSIRSRFFGTMFEPMGYIMHHEAKLPCVFFVRANVGSFFHLHPTSKQNQDNPAGGCKYFLFSPLLGEMIQFDSYFSNGLKPQTRKPRQPFPPAPPFPGGFGRIDLGGAEIEFS